MKYNVLIVDDKYYDFNEQLNDYFKDSEIRFEYSNSPKDAVEKLTYDEKGIDVILMDIKFEGLDKIEGIEPGIWALREIKKMDPDFPIGIITDFPSPSAAFFSGTYRASFFLEKEKFLPYEYPNDDYKLEQLKKKISEVIIERKINNKFIFDPVHQRLANELSENYNEEEWGSRGSPGTISYCLWEDSIISSEIGEISKRNEDIVLLDIGCGTGRFEVLMVEYSNLRIEAIDFSGGMLKQARSNWKSLPKSRKKAKVNFSRGIAEKLKFASETFDMILMGFGLVSYTRNYLSLNEASRVLKPGGIAIFSCYNEESWSLKAIEEFERINDVPISAKFVKTKAGYDKLNLGDSFQIDIELFTCEQFSKAVKLAGFNIRKIRSFPTLYASIPLYLTTSVKEERKPENLVEERFYLAKDVHFNPVLHRMDEEFSENIVRNKGHYILIVGEKRK